jgi:hypothetical protein
LYEQDIHIVRIMGFPKDQKKMVAGANRFIPADHRINAVYGGRNCGRTFYLYIILIFPGRKEREQ